MSEALNAAMVLGLMLLWLIASSAKADAYDTDWCKTFAAETVTVLRITDPDYATADKAAVDLLTSRVWAACLNSDEPPTMAAIGVSLKGVVPVEWTNDRRIRSVRWRVKRWAWVDPLKETQAQAEALSARLTSRTRLADEAGEEFEDILEELAEEQKLAAQLGVVLDAPTPAAAQPSEAAPSATDDEDPDHDSTDSTGQ
jgi:capsid protein